VAHSARETLQQEKLFLKVWPLSLDGTGGCTDAKLFS
jgi:hypothetical protein